MTKEERDSDRDKYKTKLSINFEKVKKAIDDGSVGDVLGEVAFVLTIIILIFIVALLSIPFFIVTCCCVKKNNQSVSQKLYFYITIGVVIAFAAFFWTLVGFIATID